MIFEVFIFCFLQLALDDVEPVFGESPSPEGAATSLGALFTQISGLAALCAEVCNKKLGKNPRKSNHRVYVLETMGILNGRPGHAESLS
jgi:hypothetical protein